MEENNVGREMTFGEKAVGLTFNPSGDKNVEKIKRLYADIIDVLKDLYPTRTDGNREQQILIRKAISEAQGAQMWAVKGITYKY